MSMTQIYAAPGVYVSEQLLAPPPQTTLVSPSTAGFVGEHWRGPLMTPVQCNSWQDFVSYFGGFQVVAVPVLANHWLPFAVYEFFNNGGSTCWVTRIGASVPSGQVALLTLTDSASVGTPNPTLQLSPGFLGVGGSVGTWANGTPLQTTPQVQGEGLYAAVTSGGTGSPPGTFNLLIYYGGTAAGNLVEQWSNLSMTPNNVRYAPTILNSTKAGSLYVFATDLHSPSTPPLNAPAITTAPLPFLGGIDAGSPTAVDRINAMTYGGAAGFAAGALDMVPGILNINMPGESTQSVLQQAIAYCTSGPSGRPYSFLVIDPPQNSAVASVVSFTQQLQGVGNSTFASIYYPWVTAANPATQAMQATVTMPPGGFILGQYASVDFSTGPWYAPAGLTTNMTGAVGLERALAPKDYGALNLANVNALRIMPQSGQVVIFGARTLLTQYANVYVPIRRTLNYIEAQLSNLLNYALFQPNNSLLWGTITATCLQFLSGMAGRNAFQGTTQAQQFYVICNASNNPPSSVAQGIVNTNVGVALNAPAEFVNLTVTQFQATATTTVTQS